MANQVHQPIDLKSLEDYLNKHYPFIKTPLSVQQFESGQSNPTYLLTLADGARYVLRKKPPGKLLSKTAHQLEREYKILHALKDTSIPVPTVYGLCEDVGVIGTTFYIIEFLDGRLFADPTMPGVSAEDRMEMWHDAMRILGNLHRVDVRGVGLDDLGRHSGFYDRQIKTLSNISATQALVVDVESGQAVGALAHFENMVSFFKDRSTQPKDRSALVHGDYKIDNLMFHKTLPKVIGVLDWEMATIGHPLSDIVNVTGPYSWDVSGSKLLTDGTIAMEGGKPEFKAGVTPGLPALEQVLQWYRDQSGYDVSEDLPWGNVFGGFRLAVIIQGIAARQAVRQASGRHANLSSSLVRPYSEWLAKRVDRLKSKDKPKL